RRALGASLSWNASSATLVVPFLHTRSGNAPSWIRERNGGESVRRSLRGGTLLRSRQSKRAVMTARPPGRRDGCGAPGQRSPDLRATSEGQRTRRGAKAFRVLPSFPYAAPAP